MREKEKTIHQLKREVLVAYLTKKTPGLSKQAKKHWDEKYEASREALEKAIAQASADKIG